MVRSTKYAKGCLKGNTMFFYTHVDGTIARRKVQVRHLKPPLVRTEICSE